MQLNYYASLTKMQEKKQTRETWRAIKGIGIHLWTPVEADTAPEARWAEWPGNKGDYLSRLLRYRPVPCCSDAQPQQGGAESSRLSAEATGAAGRTCGSISSQTPLYQSVKNEPETGQQLGHGQVKLLQKWCQSTVNIVQQSDGSEQRSSGTKTKTKTFPFHISFI